MDYYDDDHNYYYLSVYMTTNCQLNVVGSTLTLTKLATSSTCKAMTLLNSIQYYYKWNNTFQLWCIDSQCQHCSAATTNYAYGQVKQEQENDKESQMIKYNTCISQLHSSYVIQQLNALTSLSSTPCLGYDSVSATSIRLPSGYVLYQWKTIAAMDCTTNWDYAGETDEVSMVVLGEPHGCQMDSSILVNSHIEHLSTLFMEQGYELGYLSQWKQLRLQQWEQGSQYFNLRYNCGDINCSYTSCDLVALNLTVDVCTPQPNNGIMLRSTASIQACTYQAKKPDPDQPVDDITLIIVGSIFGPIMLFALCGWCYSRCCHKHHQFIQDLRYKFEMGRPIDRHRLIHFIISSHCGIYFIYNCMEYAIYKSVLGLERRFLSSIWCTNRIFYHGSFVSSGTEMGLLWSIVYQPHNCHVFPVLVDSYLFGSTTIR
jgi:hypothetical protein